MNPKIKVFMLVLIFFFIANIIFPQNTSLPSVTIEKLPANIEEFVAMRDKIADTHQGGAATFLTALIIYTLDRNFGMQCLTVALAQEHLIAEDVYKGYKPWSSEVSLIESQLGKNGHPYIANSYVKGATPANQYKLPDKDLTFEFFKNPYSDKDNGYFKIFVKCSGAATPRPITLKQNNRGIWKAWGISSVLVGIIIMYPEVEPDDTL